jgi:glycosyltransferase involved in cell wall biosynthesis
MAIIDIIVGVKNEEEHIERCIKSLQKQTIQDINIVVVDGLSDDKTPEIVRELMTLDPRIVLLSNDKEKISSGRNIGLDFSKSEYVAYLDGHTYVQEDWLRYCITHL